MTFTRKFIPSLFTVLNAFCGFVSIISSSQSDFVTASYFIIYAGLFDMFDGIVARLLNSSSDFGVELDSLSDVVSFGVAPSYLIYSLYFHNLNGIGIAISSLIMIFGAIRLARFNVELVGFEKDKFYGIPTPITAMTVVFFVIFYYDKILDQRTSIYFLYGLSLVLPVLMVSKFQYPAMPKINRKSLVTHKWFFITTLIIIVVSAISKGVFVFPVLLCYIISGILISFYKIVFKSGKQGKRKKIS